MWLLTYYVNGWQLGLLGPKWRDAYGICTLRTKIGLESPAVRCLRVRLPWEAASYEAVGSAINRYLVAGARPRSEDLQREQDARAGVGCRPSLIPYAWMLP